MRQISHSRSPRRAAAAGTGALSGLAAVCLAAAYLTAAPAPDQAPASAPLPADLRATAERLRDEALRGTGAYEIVRSLTVEVGPRLAGSPGDRAGVEWGLRTLKALGLENVRAEKVTVPHWQRGEAVGEILAPYPQPLALAALGGSVGTPEGGIEAEVLRVPSLEAFAALPPEAARGRIVFFDGRMERTRDGSGYGRAVPVRGAGPVEAARRGALAVLIRSVGTGNARFPHTGSLRYQDDVPRIPAAALAGPDADLLAAQLASGRPVSLRLRLGCRYLPDAESANVIGEVPGREKPEEVVLLGAHLDSWDLGTGAVDDGAGCAIVAEAARRIAALPRRPRRTIRVVLYANEEFGLSGARAYAEAHAAELPRHVMAAESDFGSGKVWGLAGRVDPERVEALAEVGRLLAPLGVEFLGNEARGGADLIPLAEARVPLADLRQDGTYYFDWHHTADDTLDKIDPKDLDQNVAAWAAFAYAVAEMPGDLGRAPERAED
jgi:hypothetical protein